MGIPVGNDYPLALTNITDKGGNPAAIDGAPTFAVNPEGGTIEIAAGRAETNPDGTPAFPDGAPFYRAVGTVDTIVKLTADVDPNLNPDVTDDARVAELTDVLVAGTASVGSIVLGKGFPTP